MRKPLAILFAMFAAGCADAEVMGGDEHVVWLREPYLGEGSPNKVAARYCSQFDKRPNFERKFELGHGAFKEVWVFGCHKPGEKPRPPSDSVPANVEAFGAGR